jgi:putative ABC transport system substrate-binding protein
MRRRDWLLGAAALAAYPGSLLAQAARLPRVGYLVLPALSEPPTQERRAFLHGLREQGYVPGRNLEIVYKSAENELVFMDDVARDLVAQKVDVIATAGSVSTLSAKRATSTIPIVMMAVGDPVGIGVVKSLARPGENITGVSFISSELAPKRVDLLRTLVPGCRRLAILYAADNANARLELAETVAAARSLGIAAEPIGVEADSKMSAALEEEARRRADALYVVSGDGMVAGNRSLIAEHGLRRKVAVVSGWSSLTDAGGLLSYAPDIPDMFRRSAFYVHRILRGAKPAGLPIEMPARIELVINLRTARAIGVKITQDVLLRADRVIE